jgi:CheY-like chemotaxis protein
MAFILAIQPDPQQASALKRALRQLMNVEVLVVDSTEAALGAIDTQVPDVILLHALMAPGDEEHLVACLRTLRGASHVQTLQLPQLQAALPSDRSQSRPRWIGLSKSKPPLSLGCDHRLFATVVFEYLSCARDLKEEIEYRKSSGLTPASERRQARRWLTTEVPWVSAVKLAAGEQADLIDISSSGALLRSYDRPRLRSLKDPGLAFGPRPGLTLQLASGEEIHVGGRVVRWQAGSAGNGAPRFDVALRFDESVDLFLPTSPLLAPETVDYDMRAIAVVAPHERSTVTDQWGAW